MSHEENVEVITLFLRQRASLRRVTNHQEVQRVAGEQLHLNGRRGRPRMLEREEVIAAFDTIAGTEEGLALTTLVVHFWDNDPPSRFPVRADALGHTFDSPDDVGVYREELMEQAFNAHANWNQVPDSPASLQGTITTTVPDGLSTLRATLSDVGASQIQVVPPAANQGAHFSPDFPGEQS